MFLVYPSQPAGLGVLSKEPPPVRFKSWPKTATKGWICNWLIIGTASTLKKDENAALEFASLQMLPTVLGSEL
jgi:hypothetical protein